MNAYTKIRADSLFRDIAQLISLDLTETTSQ